MQEIIMILSALIGGGFLGFLGSLLAFFVWGLIKEGFEDPKKMAIPTLFLLGIFGIALVYLIGVVFQSWLPIVSAAISFAYFVRPLFKVEG